MKTVNIKREFDTSIELKDNAMLKVKPELFNEWDFEKNDNLGLDIYKVTYGSGKKVWWIGKCGHSWDTTITRRCEGSGCPYCCHPIQRVLKGFNDMWTTNPELALLLANPNDGYEYTDGSHKKVDWKCNKCGEINKEKSILDVSKRGIHCGSCADGKSYPEKFTRWLLKSLNINHQQQKSFNWSNLKRYDFYLPDYNLIIETHGGQHYREGFQTAGGRTLLEEQINDRYKYAMALHNGIDKYIVIDCRSSEISWIKKSILNSELATIFNLNDVDWLNIDRKCNESAHLEVLNLWNSERTLESIQDETGYRITSINRILKKFREQGAYVFTPPVKTKNIVQLDMSGNKIEIWSSIAEASDKTKTNKIGISYCCKGERHTAGGFRWMYEEDYIENKEKSNLFYNKSRGIVQLTLDGVFVKYWDSVIEASNNLNLKNPTSIYTVVRGERKVAGGFGWMYKDEYDKNLTHSIPVTDFKTNLKDTPVIQLNLDGTYEKEWISISEASRGVGLKYSASVGKACRGELNSSAGYKWMYKDDYEKLSIKLND